MRDSFPWVERFGLVALSKVAAEFRSDSLIPRGRPSLRKAPAARSERANLNKPCGDAHFVDVRFMFSGDRLIVVKAYLRKGTIAQIELPLDGRDKAPNPKRSPD